MQNSTTILGIIEMRLKGISYDDCRNRYGVGNSTVNLIMTRYLEKGVPLEVLKQMPAEEVEASFSTRPPMSAGSLRTSCRTMRSSTPVSTGRAARQTCTFCGSGTSRSIPPATSTPNSAITSTSMSAPTMDPRAFVWPWRGSRESGCTSTGLATSRSFWWTLRPENYGRYISSSPPSASAA